MATILGADARAQWKAELAQPRYNGMTAEQVQDAIADPTAEDVPVIVTVREVERYFLTHRWPLDGNTLKSNIRRSAAGTAFATAQEAAADFLDSLRAFEDVGFDSRHEGVADTIAAHFAEYVGAGIMSLDQANEIRGKLSRKGSRAELLELPLPSVHQVAQIMAES